MNKVKLLTILVVLLAVLNIVLLGAMYLKGHPNHMGHVPKNKKEADLFIKERFAFDDNQMTSFSESKQRHFVQIESLQKALLKESENYYLSYDKGNQYQDSLLSEILKINELIYLANNLHFQEVKSICNPNQLPELDNFIGSLLHPRPQGPDGKRPPRGDR